MDDVCEHTVHHYVSLPTLKIDTSFESLIAEVIYLYDNYFLKLLPYNQSGKRPLFLIDVAFVRSLQRHVK